MIGGVWRTKRSAACEVHLRLPLMFCGLLVLVDMLWHDHFSYIHSIVIELLALAFQFVLLHGLQFSSCAVSKKNNGNCNPKYPPHPSTSKPSLPLCPRHSSLFSSVRLSPLPFPTLPVEPLLLRCASHVDSLESTARLSSHANGGAFPRRRR